MPLVLALIAYAALAAVVSWSQFGYCNPDFVAYSTIGHLTLTEPAASVSGYWSPLFSWAMAPLLALQVEDLLAGRLVLLAAGAGYVLAVHALVVRLGCGPLVRGAALTCAVLQGSLWATHLLDPDLIASALFFVCLWQLSDAQVLSGRWRGLATGATAGLAYLGKAYMLPFFVLFLPIALVLQARRPGTARPTKLRQPMLWVAAGLLLTAGPWLLILSMKYDSFTFSTAGPANHANLGPVHYGDDPLWNPPLEAEFILDPHFSAPWSPVGSWENFGHQLMLVLRNVGRSLERLAGWVLMLGAAVWFYTRRARRTALPEPTPATRAAFRFVLVAAAVYLPGYLLIDVERRYVMPTVGPLLCIAAALLLARISALGRSRPLLLGVLIATFFGVQEVRLLFITARNHPQSHDHTEVKHLADGLAAAHFTGRFAASRWHPGLAIAYAAGRLSHYLGAPLAATPAARTAEFEAAGVHYYLQFPGDGGVFPNPAPVEWPRATARLADTEEFRDCPQLPVEVFARPR